MEVVPMAPPQEPSRVLVLVYPEHATAEVVYEKIRAMDKDGRIKVVDAALVTADERGELTVVSTHRHATKSFAKAAAGGLLIGAEEKAMFEKSAGAVKELVDAMSKLGV